MCRCAHTPLLPPVTLGSGWGAPQGRLGVHADPALADGCSEQPGAGRVPGAAIWTEDGEQALWRRLHRAPNPGPASIRCLCLPRRGLRTSFSYQGTQKAHQGRLRSALLCSAGGSVLGRSAQTQEGGPCGHPDLGLPDVQGSYRAYETRPHGTDDSTAPPSGIWTRPSVRGWWRRPWKAQCPDRA